MSSTSLSEAVRAAADPLQFEAFLDAWNARFDEVTETQQDLTAAVEDTLAQIAAGKGGEEQSDRIGRRLNALPHPALSVRRDGRIVAVNEAALRRIGADVGDPVEAVGYELDGAEAITSTIALVLSGTNTPGGALLRRAHGSGGRTATLAFVPTARNADAEDSVLIFVIDPEWSSEVQRMLSDSAGLTQSEGEIVAAFVAGQTLEDIAETRGRALSTVRTQFNTILAKVGARGQADLMRTALTLSQFTADLGDIADTVAHPTRRRVQILSSGGRVADATLSGDPKGAPVVFMPTMTQNCLLADGEEAFRRAGLRAIHLWRPGFAETDPPSGDQDVEGAMTADFVALLDQLHVRKVPLVAYDTATRDAFALAGRAGDRIAGLVLVSSGLPPPMNRKGTVGAPWAEALIRTTQASPAFLKLMVRAGIRTWRILGSRRFSQMQLRGSAPDAAVIARADYVRDADAGVRQSNLQGIEANYREVLVFSEDWRDLAAACPAPVTFLHGAHDPCFSIDGIRRLAADIDADVDEVEDGGFLTRVSHPERLIAAIRRFLA